MSAAKAFIDTNLLVYLYSDSEISKRSRVIQEINQYERFVSTQVLNEFCNVCIRKLKLPIDAIQNAVEEIKTICNLIIVDGDTIHIALRLHEKLGYSYYDCLMLSSALGSGCQYLLSEDMASGHVIEESLTIKNVLVDSE